MIAAAESETIELGRLDHSRTGPSRRTGGEAKDAIIG
jgi:hypothetical protein